MGLRSFTFVPAVCFLRRESCIIIIKKPVGGLVVTVPWDLLINSVLTLTNKIRIKSGTENQIVILLAGHCRV